MPPRTETVEIEVMLHRSQAKAWFVSDDGDEANAVWIPKSKAGLLEERGKYTLTIPEDLAIEKGLA